MKKKLLLYLSLFMVTAFTVSSAQTGTITIVSIQSPVEVGKNGTIQLTYTSSVPCTLNTQLRETNPSTTTVNWGPWHGQFDVVSLPAAASPTAVTVNYPVSSSEVVSTNLPANVQYTFAFQLKPTAGGGGYGFKDGTSANLVTIVPSSTVVNSVNITSAVSTVAAGTDLVVNFNYTLVNDGKVKVEVRKFDGTTYIGGAGALVKDIYIDPATATTVTPDAGSKTLSIPSGTIPSSLLTGNENYKVVVTIYTNAWGYIADTKSNIQITAPPSWNGSTSAVWTDATNWSTGVVPSSANFVIIPSGTLNNPVISANTTVAGATIASGATLTVNEGKVLTNTGTITNSGDLILKSSATGTASLLSTTSVTNVTQQCYLSSVHRGWRLLSNPLSTITFSALAIASSIPMGANYTGTYDSTTNTWTDGATSMASQQAYKVFITGLLGESPTYASGPSNVTFVNKGTAANTAPTTIATVANQFYLLTNPYTAPVSLYSIIGASSGLSNSVSYYNPNKNSTDVKIKAGGYDVITTIGSALAKGDSNDVVIPPMGTIFVQASSIGTINIPKSAIYTGLVSGGNYNLKTAQTKVNAPVALNLDVSSNGVNCDRVQLRFKEIGSAGSNIDFGKLPNTFLDAYSIAGTNKMAVSELELKDQTIPLGISSTVQKSFTFKVVENTIPAGYEAVLIDNVLGTNTVMTPGTGYDFAIDSTPASQGDARFSINLKTAGSLLVDQNKLDANIQVYPNPSRGQFNISNTLEGASTIEISSLNGQIIHSQKLNSGTTTIQTKSWATGIYILKASNNGTETTKKLIIQ